MDDNVYNTRRICPICGRTMYREGFCNECCGKLEEIFPHGEWEYMNPEEIKAAFDHPSEYAARTAREEARTVRQSDDDDHLRTEGAVCVSCRRTIDKKDDYAANLKGGACVCSECAAKVRILFPLDYTWEFRTCYSNITDEGDSEDTAVCVDPLNHVDTAGFFSALQKAKEERQTRRNLYGTSKAYFRVDDTWRMIRNIGRGRRFISDEYAISGTVLLGEINKGCRISVKRREGSYSFSVKRMEAPLPEGFTFVGEADRIREGCYGRMILAEDAACVYPGDVLSVEGC